MQRIRRKWRGGRLQKNDLSNFFYNMRMYPALPFPSFPSSIIVFSSRNLLHKYTDQSRRIWWAGHVSRLGEERKVYKVLVGKPGKIRPLGRQRSRWEKGNRMDLREIGWGCGVDLSGSGQRPVAGCCECVDKPSGSGATELVR
jgi:hypothetical protein